MRNDGVLLTTENHVNTKMQLDMSTMCNKEPMVCDLLVCQDWKGEPVTVNVKHIYIVKLFLESALEVAKLHLGRSFS